MVDILDVPKLYKKVLADKYRWTYPLTHEHFWYSKDYHKEIIDMFENTSTGMKIVFVELTLPPKMIKNDHK